jgi:hypothetical protein
MRKSTLKNRYRSLDQLKELTKQYDTRGELYYKNQSLYMCLYKRGVLDQACAHMKPSRKKNKFVYGILNITKVIAPAFQCSTLIEFREKYSTAYDTGRRFGVDYVELFENKDNSKYLRDLIIDLGQENIARFSKTSKEA